MVPKTESRRPEGPVLRFRFCGENVGRSFVVCSHDPILRTDKNLQFVAKTITGILLSAPFIFSRRVSDENRACSISIHFFKFTDPCVGRSFSMCSHDPIFGTNKNRILKNRSYEQAFKTQLSLTTHEIQYKVDWIVQATMTPSAYARFQFNGGFGRSRGPAFHIYDKKQ